MIAARPATTKQEQQKAEREARILQMARQVEIFKHGYCTVPNIEGTDTHVVHVDKDYIPDFCTCINHEKGGTRCAHKQAAFIRFAGHRTYLKQNPQPVYYYRDVDAEKRGLEPNARVAGRWAMLTNEEQLAIYTQEFDPNYVLGLMS